MTHATTEKWVRVTRAVPCPICGKRTYCGFTPDMAQVRCMRVPSERPVEDKQGGTGWMHRLTDPIPVVTPPKPKARKLTQFASYFAHHKLATTHDHIQSYAKSLGLNPGSGHRLGMVWDRDKKCAVFPMYVNGEVVGGRCRAVSGAKWSLEGTSNEGLFMPDGGEIPDLVEQLYVVEGVTDAWALLDLGLYGVGRSFSHGSSAEIVRISVGRDVVILPDQDAPKPMPDGSVRCVGMDGALRLADALKGQARSVRVVPGLLGAKDLRAFVGRGGTADDLMCLVKAAGVRR